MRLLVPLLCVLLAAPASAQETRGRGWLTGVGLGLTAASLALAGAGLGFALSAADWAKRYAVYDATRDAAEVDARVLARDERNKATTVATAFFIAGGAAALAGVVMLLIDSALKNAPVTLVPSPSGVVLLGQF